MNLSILFTELPLLERPAAAAAAGFTAVELWWPWPDSPTPPQAELDALKKALDGAGTRLVGLNFYAGQLPGPDRDDDFKKKFPWFVDHWGGNPDFACVVAYDGEEAVGFAYGAPAAEGREWWREHVDTPPEKTLTFSYSELAVHPKKRKQGVADALSRALLEERPEDLAVLLVDVKHPRVQAAGRASRDEPKPLPMASLLVDDGAQSATERGRRDQRGRRGPRERRGS